MAIWQNIIYNTIKYRRRRIRSLSVAPLLFEKPSTNINNIKPRSKTTQSRPPTFNNKKYLNIKQKYGEHGCNININIACLLDDTPFLVEWAFEGCNSTSNNSRSNLQMSEFPIILTNHNKFRLKGGMPAKRKNNQNRKIRGRKGDTDDDEEDDEEIYKNKKNHNHNRNRNRNRKSSRTKPTSLLKELQPLASFLPAGNKSNNKKKSNIIIGNNDLKRVQEFQSTKKKRKRSKVGAPKQINQNKTGIYLFTQYISQYLNNYYINIEFNV